MIKYRCVYFILFCFLGSNLVYSSECLEDKEFFFEITSKNFCEYDFEMEYIGVGSPPLDVRLKAPTILDNNAVLDNVVVIINDIPGKSVAMEFPPSLKKSIYEMYFSSEGFNGGVSNIDVQLVYFCGQSSIIYSIKPKIFLEDEEMMKKSKLKKEGEDVYILNCNKK